MTVLSGAARDSGVVAWRNLTNIRRLPDALLGATVQPIMFVLLFAYVFAGSLGGQQYREWLIAGIFAQTVAFNSAFTTIGMAADLQKGIIDRFRSLPMSRLAVIVGRTTSDLVVNAVTIVIMALTGLIVGWRILGGVTDAVLGFALLLLFAFALLLLFGFSMIWIGILVGSAMHSVEAVNGLMFTTMFPITFLANTFAPTGGMAPWLRTIAEWNPISSLVQAMRELWGNGPAAPPSAAWPLQHAIGVSIGWSLLITAVVAPLAIRAYARRTND